MTIDPYSTDNQWLALTRMQGELPALVGEASRQDVRAAVATLLERLAPGKDDQERRSAALDLQDLVAPYAAARKRFREELQIQAALQRMVADDLAAWAEGLVAIDAGVLAPSFAFVLVQVQAELAEPIAPDGEQPRLVKIGVGGVEGGRVIRLRNLLVDIKALATTLAGIVLTKADVLGAPDPVTAMAGLLLILFGLRDAVTEELDTDEATVFWGLLMASNGIRRAEEGEIVAVTNRWRERYELGELPAGEVAAHLRKLAQLGVTTQRDGGWELVDRYEIV